MSGFLPDPVSVEILWQGDQQPCRVRLTLPDGSGDLGELPAGLLEQARSFEDAVSGEELEAYGKLLYQMLFPGNLSNQYAAALKASGSRGLRLSLRLDESQPSLHRIPWERLFQPQGSQWVPLAAGANVFFSRFLQTGQSWGVALPSGPLKVLVVISSPFPADNPLAVNSEAEQQAIAAVLDGFPGQIEYDVLKGPVTLQQIGDRLNQGTGFDILHYIGHGDWREDEQQGYLILTGTLDDGSIGPVGASSAEVVRMLSSCARLPQLISLGACESGQQSSNDAFAGMGPQLVKAGCPAVICMQEKVENAVARRFGQAFFSSLLESGCVDWAVNRARSGLLENAYAQWAVPVLYMHLVDGILFNPHKRFKSAERQPYKFLSPYRPEDSDLFKGRAGKVAEIHQHLCEQDIAVLYGEPGVGMTSLLEAGVRPAMEADGWFVASISDYSDLAAEFRVQLQVDGHPLNLRVSGDAPLPDLLRAAGSGPLSNLVLILDQFESALALPDTNQQAILQALQDSLSVAEGRLKLAFALHKDAVSDLVRFQALLSGKSGSWIEVPPLCKEDAVEAIIQPLDVLGWPVTLNPELAREQIVPDLCSLFGEQEEAGQGTWIDPGQLQITCTWLYQKARQRRPPLIDEALYLKEAGGADGILVRYMEEELQTNFASQQDLARKVLIALAAPDLDRWSSPEQIASRIPPNGTNPGTEDVRQLLDRFTQAELLVRRQKDRQYLYSFANQTIAEEAVRLGGKQAEQSYNAADELERTWRLWLAAMVKAPAGNQSADRVLASRHQLRLLSQSSEQLDARPIKVLMLLRSAVLRDEPVQPWLNWLKAREEGLGLIRALELPEIGQAAASGSARELAGRLLGLNHPDAPFPTGGAFGPVSWAASSSPDSVDRRTAAMALSILPPAPNAGLSRLQAAVEELPAASKRTARRSELFGALADAGPDLAGWVREESKKHSAFSRAGIYLWRVWRRIVQNRRWIAWLTWGSAIGGGLGLGVERLLVGLMAQSHPGVLFLALFSYWGLVLSGLTLLLMNLSSSFLLQNHNVPAPIRKRWVEILFGTVGFGLANWLVAWFNGISFQLAPLVVPLGFLAGVGVSAAFSGSPKKAVGWLWRGLLGALTFVLAQLIFIALPKAGSGISTSLSAGYFQVEFEYFSATFWQQWVQSSDHWAATISIIESAFAGASFVLGALWGRHIGEGWYERLKDALERLGE